MITLEDVTLQLGLLVDGQAVTEGSRLEWGKVCLELLGEIPLADYLDSSRLEKIWLGRTLATLPENPTIQDIKGAVRAYILCLIEGILMLDKSSNRVHLMYLPIL